MYYNFSAKGRLPVVPLSLEYKDFAQAKELVVDYKTGNVFVVTENHELVNICASTTTMEAFSSYLQDHPDIIENLVVTVPDNDTEDGEITDTIKNVLDFIYGYIDEINSRSFNYAASDTDGGAALIAKRLANTLTIRTESGTEIYNGNSDVSINLDQYYSSNGGDVNGDMALKGKLILSENVMYGTSLPTTGVEGQLFFLIEE